MWFRLRTGIVLEDALITYRYAENLAVGQGFVFNPGEQVLGTTTPLLTLMLGAMGTLLGAQKIPLISNVMMILAAGGAALLTQSLVRRLGYGWLPATLVMAIFCFHPGMLWMTTGGMETPLILLLMAAGAWALVSQKWILAGVFSALLVLARVDGALWAAGVYAVILARDRRALPGALAAGALITAPWALFAFWYFGSPIPHSVIAKLTIGDDFSLASFAHMKEFASWISPHLAAVFPAAALVGFFLLAAGAFELLRQRADPLRWMLVVFPFAFILSLYLGRSPLWFDWYLAPVDWCVVIAGGLGLWSLGRRLIEMSARVAWARWPAGLAVAALCVLYGVSLWSSDVETVTFQRAWQVNENKTRRAVGEWLEQNTPREAVIAMEAIGYQAYYSRRRVIDLAGLVSPAVVKARRESATNAEAFHRILEDLKPDYLVLRSYEADTNAHYHGGPLFETNAHRDSFWAHYREIRRFIAPLPDFWGLTAYLTIYQRVG